MGFYERGYTKFEDLSYTFLDYGGFYQGIVGLFKDLVDDFGGRDKTFQDLGAFGDLGGVFYDLGGVGLC